MGIEPRNVFLFLVDGGESFTSWIEFKSKYPVSRQLLHLVELLLLRLWMQRDFLLGYMERRLIASVVLFVTGKVASRPHFLPAQSDVLNL